MTYLFKAIIFAIAYVVGFIVTPVNYFIRNWLRSKFPKVTWWFLNDTVGISNTDIDAGDFGRFDRNFIGYFKQNAIRNSHWNLKMLLRIKGKFVGNMSPIISIRYNQTFGSLYRRFTFGKYNLFQYSYLYKIGKFYIHGQFGYSILGRELYKLKAGKIKDLPDKHYTA